jgi:hypothetical protein
MPLSGPHAPVLVGNPGQRPGLIESAPSGSAARPKIVNFLPTRANWVLTCCSVCASIRLGVGGYPKGLSVNRYLEEPAAAEKCGRGLMLLGRARRGPGMNGFSDRDHGLPSDRQPDGFAPRIGAEERILAPFLAPRRMASQMPKRGVRSSPNRPFLIFGAAPPVFARGGAKNRPGPHRPGLAGPRSSTRRGETTIIGASGFLR